MTSSTEMLVPQHQGDPVAPYETAVFQKVYKELVPEPPKVKPLPPLDDELPSLEELLKSAAE